VHVQTYLLKLGGRGPSVFLAFLRKKIKRKIGFLKKL
jgi:hypothetical protein